MTNINALYLSVGGYSEIMTMCYWDFATILNTRTRLNQSQSGSPIIQEGLYQSQKDMIANRTK